MTSPRDILKKHGKWIEASPYVNLVERECSISERQAKRRIKKAWKDGEVQRLVLPDRSVWYGLRRWPTSALPSKQHKETLSFREGYAFLCFRRLEEIGDDSAERSSPIAMKKISSLIHMLPPELIEKALPHLDEVWEPFWERQRRYPGNYVDETGSPEVNYLVNKVSTLLHEWLGKTS